jgi:Tfp pilus assembly PilM family ATPase
MRRTGIDLSATRCLLADAEAPAVERRHGERRGFRVHRFASLSDGDSSQGLTTALKALTVGKEFPRHAWINLWNLPSSHQYLLLPSGAADELESKARQHAASVLGMSVAEVTISTVIGATRAEAGHHPKTEVSFFAAGTHEIRQRLRPFIEAGFIIEGVTTPCGALWSQARLRKPALPGEVHAHLAIGRAQSALGIFCNGALLYARDMDWGHGDTASDEAAPPNRQKLARRLATELRHSFLYLKQYWDDDVSQVVLSGDMPEIRSLTAPLIEFLNVEVETLDTLEGIDASSIPEGFGEQAATFRLATSISADPPPINLLPPGVTSASKHHSGGWLVAGAAAAAIALAFIYRDSGSSSSEEKAPAETVAGERAPVESTPLEIPAAQMPPPHSSPPAPPPRSQQLQQPAARGSAAVARSAVATQPDPVVRGILVSANRRVALIGDRIVSPGDSIGNAVVSSIEPDAVVLAMADGRSLRIELARPAHPAAQ